MAEKCTKPEAKEMRYVSYLVSLRFFFMCIRMHVHIMCFYYYYYTAKVPVVLQKFICLIEFVPQMTC